MECVVALGKLAGESLVKSQDLNLILNMIYCSYSRLRSLFLSHFEMNSLLLSPGCSVQALCSSGWQPDCVGALIQLTLASFIIVGGSVSSLMVLLVSVS